MYMPAVAKKTNRSDGLVPDQACATNKQTNSDKQQTSSEEFFFFVAPPSSQLANPRQAPPSSQLATRGKRRKEGR